MSNEAEVSISSAKNIIENFDYNRYELIKIFRSKNNKFYKINKIEDTENLMDEQEIHTKDFKSFIDIIFPITHGKF